VILVNNKLDAKVFFYFYFYFITFTNSHVTHSVDHT